MAIELYWGSGSPYAWRVMLALERKRLDYVSHRLEFAKQEHKGARMLAMNPRGRLPVLKDGDYVCYESLAILYYLERRYPEPAIFGRTPAEAGSIMRVICEYQAYVEAAIVQIVSAVFLQALESRADEVAAAMHTIDSEAKALERRLLQAGWLVGAEISAADMIVFPGIQLLFRALERREAKELRARLLPLEPRFPGIARWIRSVEQLPGYERSYPPHWREPMPGA